MKANANDKKIKLGRLQRDYLLDALAKMQEAIELANILETSEDEEIIRSYSARIDTLVENVEENERLVESIAKSGGLQDRDTFAGV